MMLNRDLLLQPAFDEAFKRTYLRKVLGFERDSLLCGWMQNELSGDTSYDLSGNGFHGTYDGATLGQDGVPGMGLTSVYYDGDNDVNDFYSSAFNTAYDGAECTMVQWLKIKELATWTDGKNRAAIQIGVDGNNHLLISRIIDDNKLLVRRKGAGTESGVSLTSMSTLDWMCIILAISENDDRVEVYLDGIQQGATQTGLGEYSGNIASDRARIGNDQASQDWYGWIGPTLVYTKRFSSEQALYMSTR